MTADPGFARRLGMRVFRALPDSVSQAAIHAIAPTFAAGAVALIEHDGTVLGLRQRHRTGLSLPGGLLDRGEQPADAVVREVREETGLVITAGDLHATILDAEVHHVDFVFRVVCETEPVVVPASEATSHEWVALEDWPDPDYSTDRILRGLRDQARDPSPGRIVGSGG